MAAYVIAGADFPTNKIISHWDWGETICESNVVQRTKGYSGHLESAPAEATPNRVVGNLSMDWGRRI